MIIGSKLFTGPQGGGGGVSRLKMLGVFVGKSEKIPKKNLEQKFLPLRNALKPNFVKNYDPINNVFLKFSRHNPKNTNQKQKIK